MRLSDLADGVTRQVENLGASVSETFLEPTVRLGVTGLARSGKTVFITSLVANLLDRGRMAQFTPEINKTIRAAYLQPQPDDTIPRFDYESHLAALTGPAPHWPESTRSVSELRLSFRVQPTGLLGGLSGPRTVHVDIVDYPGEWLLDLALLDQDYAGWAEQALAKARARAEGADFAAMAAAAEADAPFEEPRAKALAEAFTAYLKAAQAAGFSDCSPGRFLLPGEMEGSPVLTFAPLPRPERPARRGLWREMERRFEAYKAQVVKPFFRNHFARIDRQIVLVDALGAIHNGPQAVENLRQSMGEILSAFRPGRNGFLQRLLLGKRVEKILFAATKADHLHHRQHPQLTAIIEALVRDARDRADFAGAQTGALAIAALRATVEETRTHAGESLDLVRGTLLETGKPAAFHPGTLPDDPARLLAPARQGAESWLDGDFAAMRFAPAPLTLKPGEGLPHIRLDRAAEFLIGDMLT
ncbi:hypothetical protein PSA7680_01208 [Pseudoruegeria aquimaris]|uniref:YcjX-like protein n=1 Tax=Pseudoruegeria aquimaris TaxID=393663 RepID=A0A1Y5RWJ5_9RHOB|nr:YcjX family protein [Pseudoruegeria aquimaris]SLN27166.1 hypothetical protein PSA7680_01208 [Pseudoruegeria aquimaris]